MDPVTKEWESPYATFSNNPIFNIDPNGDSDSTYKTPGGGSIITENSTAKTFDGGTVKVGNIAVKPPKGTLKSFVATDEGFEGGSARYVSIFDNTTGAFKGYGWDKDLTSTYDDYLKAKGEDIGKNIEHANDPMWDPNISHAQGAKNAVNLGLLLVMSGPMSLNKINTGSKAVANSEKSIVIGEGMGRVKNAAKSVSSKWYQA